MPKLSNKANNLPASPIRKLVPYAEKAKREGKTVYHLNIGQPDIRTPKVAINALNKLDLDVIEYSHSAGFETYRKKLARYYQTVGINLTHNDLMITTGGSEALIFSFLTCFNPGDEVIIPEPFYANYNGFASYAGVNVTPITANIEDGFALPKIEEFEAKIRRKTKGIIICNPGNPTGYLYTQKELEALKELVIKHDLFLIADEVYREFCYDGAKPFSVMNLEGIDDNVILVDSVSKRYSMCGARIGALASKNKEIIAAALKFAQARLSPPSLGQIAGEAALDTPQSYFDEVIDEYVERRNILVDGLNSIEGVICPKPSGAFYCLAEFPVNDTDDFCKWLLESFDYNKETVMMAPASGFYATYGLGKNQARLAYVLEKEHLEKSVEILRQALKLYPDTTL